MHTPTWGIRALPTLLACLAVVPLGVHAQNGAVSGSALRAQYEADFETLASKFTGLAGAMGGDTYAWRPMEGVRSVSEVYMLIAAENYYIPSLWNVAPPAGMTIDRNLFSSLAQVTAKDDVVEHLERSFGYLRESLAELPADGLGNTIEFFGRQRTVHEALFAMVADMHEHLGQAIAYARSNRVVPPWSR